MYLDDDLKYELIIRLHSLLTRHLASYSISSTVHEKYCHTDYFKYIKSIPYLYRVSITMFWFKYILLLYPCNLHKSGSLKTIQMYKIYCQECPDIRNSDWGWAGAKRSSLYFKRNARCKIGFIISIFTPRCGSAKTFQNMFMKRFPL